MFPQVIAMYDYQGQRSDEITMAKGDVIKVLYKENNSWWLGEHQSGQQGFFPVSYVTPCKGTSGRAVEIDSWSTKLFIDSLIVVDLIHCVLS